LPHASISVGVRPGRVPSPRGKTEQKNQRIASLYYQIRQRFPHYIA